MTIQCCVCKRVKNEDQWVGKVLHSTLNVSHSYCPQCLEASRGIMLVELSRADRKKAVFAS